MAAHGNSIQTVDEKVQFGHAASGIKFGALLLGAVAIAIAVVVSFFLGDAEHAVAQRARFYHAYLVGVAFCLSIALGGLFFTMMQHMVKVGWSVNIRRVPEALAATLPFIGILTIPLLIPVWGNKGGELYPWAVPHKEVSHHATATPAQPEQLVDASHSSPSVAAAVHAATHADDHSDSHADDHGDDHGHGSATPGYHTKYDYMKFDELTAKKQPWLSSGFFTVRIFGYFAIWTVIGWYFYGQSKKQDVTGDVEISKRLALVAPVSIIIFALTLTGAAFDLLMSLDHHWFSTIFGVYFFAGGMIGMFALTIVVFRYLQARGFVTKSVSTEHFHDLGKYLFAFVFFWSYIAFSQFMLQWYASIPEEIGWWARRGVTSADSAENTINAPGAGFAGLSLVLLLGHFLIPFAYLLSRHIKRSKEALIIGAVWMLGAHLVDMYWLVMPEYNNGEWVLDFGVIAAIVGVIGFFLFFFFQMLSTANLRPIGDPRANESLAFTNF